MDVTMAVRRYTVKQNTALPTVPRSVALGVFDGLHIGHRAVIAAACGVRNAQGGEFLRATALSITGVPKTGDKRLLTLEQEDKLLETLGTEEWLEWEFDDVCRLSPKEFVQEILSRRLGARHVCCGYNYRFGNGGTGDAECLKELCKPLGITVTVVPPMLCDDEPISSSRIRSALSVGETEQAARLLGRPFTVSFPVTEGNHKGSRWGTPTINQVFLPQYFVPKLGVYASLAVIDGKQYFAVTNVGVHPTVGGAKTPQAETWISDFSGDLYGKTVSIQLIRFLREERCFETVEALKQQILTDETVAHAVLAGEGGERTVLFDFDDTLQNRVAAFLEMAIVFTGRHMPNIDKAERLERARHMTKENNGGYVNYSEYFENLIQRWQLDASTDDLQYEYQRELPRHVKLFAETVEVLQELKRRGYRLGMVTNGRKLMQHRKLDLCGIKPLFDAVVISGEEGVHKPDAEIFRRAAARLCTAPSNCVFVGDHPVNDIAGALGAGMKAIYLNSTDRSEHPESVTEVKHLREILKYL